MDFFLEESEVAEKKKRALVEILSGA